MAGTQHHVVTCTSTSAPVKHCHHSDLSYKYIISVIIASYYNAFIRFVLWSDTETSPSYSHQAGISKISEQLLSLQCNADDSLYSEDQDMINIMEIFSGSIIYLVNLIAIITLDSKFSV